MDLKGKTIAKVVTKSRPYCKEVWDEPVKPGFSNASRKTKLEDVELVTSYALVFTDGDSIDFRADAEECGEIPCLNIVEAQA